MMWQAQGPSCDDHKRRQSNKSTNYQSFLSFSFGTFVLHITCLALKKPPGAAATKNSCRSDRGGQGLQQSPALLSSLIAPTYWHLINSNPQSFFAAPFFSLSSSHNPREQSKEHEQNMIKPSISKLTSSL